MNGTFGKNLIAIFLIILMMGALVIFQLSAMTADSARLTEVRTTVMGTYTGERSGTNTSGIEISSIPKIATGDFVIRLKVNRSGTPSSSYVIFSSVDGGEWNVLPVDDYLILNLTSILIHGSRLEKGATDFGISLNNTTVPESVSPGSVEVSAPANVAGSGGTDNFDPGYLGYILIIAGIIVIGGISLSYKAGTDQIKSIIDQLPPVSEKKDEEEAARRRPEFSYEAKRSDKEIGWDGEEPVGWDEENDVPKAKRDREGSVGWDEENDIPKVKRDRGRRTEMRERHGRRSDRADPRMGRTDRRMGRTDRRTERAPPRGRRSGNREDQVERSERATRRQRKDEVPSSERRRPSRTRTGGRYGEGRPGHGEDRRRERKYVGKSDRRGARSVDRDGARKGRDRKRRYEEAGSGERDRRRKPESRYDRGSDDWDVEYEDTGSRYSEDETSWLN